jgi:hypothetical protein
MKIVANRKRLALNLEPEIWRLPDRGRGYFGKGRRAELAPVGRPYDVFGDVLVTLARVKAMEGRNA